MTVAADSASDFTMRDLWDFAIENELEDADVMISSHGERFGVGWLGNDDGHLWLGDLCPEYLGISPAAIAVSGDPAATRRKQHAVAEELAQHLESIAAKVRKDFPA